MSEASSRPAGSARQTNGASRPNHGSDVDIVAFLGPQFFVVEGEDKTAKIRVIRIGSLQGNCSIEYETKDVTAEAGVKYEKTAGAISFSHGEAVKCIEVPIFDDDDFDTLLEFEVIFREDTAENCEVDAHSHHTRVMIHDADLFPSNALKDEIEKGGSALMDIGGTLLKAFYYFCYNHVPSIRWKSWMMVILAQVDNMYYLMQIYLRVYMVDTVLNLKSTDALDRLWAPDDRGKTMLFVAALWIFPNFVLLGVEYFEMVVLEMGFNIRYHLRVNLFRKFLSYTYESKKEVPIQDLKASIMEDIPDVVSDGYLGIFDILAMAGKLAMVALFMLQRHPKSAIGLLAYPILIAVNLQCTYKKRLKLSADEGDGEGQTVGWLIHAHHAQRLINDYRKRGFVVAKFQEVLNNQRKLVKTLKMFNFWNGQLIPWITLMVIGIYMAVAGQLVVAGKLSLGSFLATINIYKDLGDRFGKVQANVEGMVGTIEPLSGLTEQFNLETETPRRMEFARGRENYVLGWLDSNGTSSPNPAVPIFDQIPIQLKNVTVEHSPSLRAPTGLQAPQGTVVHVIGKHAVGKGTILNLLSDTIEPKDGDVLCPPHVRILNVTTDPLFVESLGFHANLVFGLSEHKLKDPDPERLRRICQRLGLNKPWMMKELNDGMRTDSDSSEEDEDEDKQKEEEPEQDDSWMDKLSRSEQKRFQLARAFVYDPEVLIIHKPVDDLDTDLKECVLGLMREFVDKRGLELDPNKITRRRPHTLIFSGGSSQLHPISDIVWRVHDQHVTSEMGSMLRR